MKSEHRHDLKTNELGRWAAEVGQSYEKYLNQIIIGAVAVLLLVAGAIYLSRSSAASASAGWNEMAAAQSAEDFANIADKHQGTAVGAWARLKECEQHLGNGIQLAFTDRASALSDLKKAREGFEKVIDDPAASDDVKERALFGLGRCLETMSDRNTEQAIAAYQRLVDEYAYTAYKTAAENRIAALKTGGSQEFYSWFHEQNPKPADRPLPRDMIRPGSSGPADPLDLNLDDFIAPGKGDAPSSGGAGADAAGGKTGASTDAAKDAGASPEQPAAEGKPDGSQTSDKPE